VRVLVTGAKGHVGRALGRTLPAGVQAFMLGREELDITEPEQVARTVARLRPDAIINAAAYTAVDRAEQEQQAACAANELGPRYLARAAAANGARLLHISTNFVFDGAASEPYLPTHAPSPINVYGVTKRDGEDAVLAELPERSVVLRTSWIYAPSGRNLLRALLDVFRERGGADVVADQIAAPTTADSVAEALWQIAAQPQLQGIHHWCDEGIVSRYEFAREIAAQALEHRVIDRPAVVRPIATADYPAPARRPLFSALDTRATQQALGIRPQQWQTNLRQVMSELAPAMKLAAS
jgi:dTDP-4-dehydrorhamnose reductase